MKRSLVNKIIIFLISILSIFLIFLFLSKGNGSLFKSIFEKDKVEIIEKYNSNDKDINNSVDNNKDNVDKFSNILENAEISIWAVYWDLPSKTFAENLPGELKSLSYFAVNFDENGEFKIPDKLKNFYNETKEAEYKKYLTIVNDVIKNDGTSIQKDTEVLNKLLYDKLAREKHINKIVTLAIDYGFDGIEIDYERLKKDMTLWDNFMLFVNELNSKASENGLDLRIVLEPSIPFEKLNFEKGPTYVMMCYNLHGGFSEPGEKATPEFITSLIEEMKRYDVKKDFAIATGGFDWPESKTNNDSGNKSKNVKSLTEKDAVLLAKEYDAEVKRNEESKYLYFNYNDENNINHEVWYADSETLNFLASFILEEGYDVSLWRIE